MDNTTPPVLDPETISELQRAKTDYGNPLLIRQLVEIYRTNAPKRIEQIREAIATGDGKTLGLVAHTLKTNCAMLGASAMAALCLTLEQRGNDAVAEQNGEKAVLGDATALLAQLESEFVGVLAALEQLLSTEPIPNP